LLVPKNFDISLLQRDYEPKRQFSACSDQKYGFLLNNDSLNVREHFVHLIDPDAPKLSTYTPLPPSSNYKNEFGNDDKARVVFRTMAHSNNMGQRISALLKSEISESKLESESDGETE